MSQDEKGNWLGFAQADRSLVDVASPAPPLPYGTGNPKRLKELVDRLAVDKVLDLGCSAAYWSPIFGKADYYGLDQEEEILSIARSNKPNGTFLKAVGENIPFKDCFFDLVFTSHVLQHNSHYPEKNAIVREIHRVLRPNGYYLCVENTGPEATPQDKSFTKEGWVEFMTARGFFFVSFFPQEEYLFRKDS